MLDALKEAAADRAAKGSIHPEQQQHRAGGHSAGIDFFFDEVEAAAWPCAVAAKMDSFAADIATIETVLAGRAKALGAEIRRDAKVESVAQSDLGVTVFANGERYHGRWLVGCDGGRSTVRKMSGIGFAGTDPEFTGYSVEATLADTTTLTPGRNLAPGGVFISAPPGTIWMADFDCGVAHRTAALTRVHVEAVLKNVSGIDVVLKTLQFASTWTDRAQLASEYRRGRVLVAGDAAHVHSPLGGQGLDLGLGDAMNLGRKLAAVKRGNAPVDLLDSYEWERQPVAAAILNWSRAQGALIRPGYRASPILRGCRIQAPRFPARAIREHP